MATNQNPITKLEQNGAEERKTPYQELLSRAISPRRERVDGRRNLQATTFSTSEELDMSPHRPCIKIIYPPGGKSSGSFW